MYTSYNSTMEGGVEMTTNDLIALLVMLVIILTKGKGEHEN